MKRLIVALLWLPALTTAHPGIGIVADRRGAIFYTDLQQVWKISGGQRSIAVPDVHTHELFLDSVDNLYGEHQWNDESGKHFYHYLWRLSPDGRLDTIVSNRPAFADADFTLARDCRGNEYYLKPAHYLKPTDTSSIVRRTLGGQEIILARGLFKGVSWLHPHTDGSVLYILNNTVYRIETDGTTSTIARGIASEQPSYAYFGNNPIVYGAWQDVARNIYVAVFSDQAVKKIDRSGAVSVFYSSKGRWSPTHGVFDKDGYLWVLECSDKNEIRAVKAATQKENEPQKKNREHSKNDTSKQRNGARLLGWAALGIVGWIVVYASLRGRKRRAEK